jgi:hypothetical protein
LANKKVDRRGHRWFAATYDLQTRWSEVKLLQHLCPLVAGTASGQASCSVAAMMAMEGAFGIGQVTLDFLFEAALHGQMVVEFNVKKVPLAARILFRYCFAKRSAA